MWIGCRDNAGETALFRKEFQIPSALQKGVVRITAGKYYRLKVNGVWLCDGPGRSLPEQFFTDTLEVDSLLHAGRNFLEVTAAGAVWVELQLEYANGETALITSDREWLTAALPLKLDGDTEFFDNRHAVPQEFQNAAELPDFSGCFRERDCRMMTRREFLLSGLVENHRFDRVQNCILPGSEEDISDAEALIYPDFDFTVIHPADGCDMVLKYSLPSESTGYWSFVVSAADGTEILLECGGKQLHFICKAGINRYTTFTRFRGGSLTVTLKNMQGDVRIQSIRLAESTYPAVKGMFQCSDYKLTRAWEAAERTLKLAMEDCFCDCVPWGRDCRNEILFALAGCGAYDLVRRTLRLGAESEPTVTWVLALEDYFNHTGDKAFVREMWSSLRSIMDKALQALSPSGLAGNVIAESFYLAGALGAAERLTCVSGDMEVSYGRAREKLLAALAAAWDARFLAWPDTPFEGSTYSVATNVLALLFDAVPAELLPMARSNVLSPRPELISPATAEEKMNRFLMLEKIGAADRIIPELLEEFSAPLDAGCTTFGNGGNAMLLYFISRLVLGMRLQADGSYMLQPETSGLAWAKGNRMTPAGAVSIQWHLEEKKLHIAHHAPAGVIVHTTNAE